MTKEEKIKMKNDESFATVRENYTLLKNKNSLDNICKKIDSDKLEKIRFFCYLICI